MRDEQRGRDGGNVPAVVLGLGLLAALLVVGAAGVGYVVWRDVDRQNGVRRLDAVEREYGLAVAAADRVFATRPADASRADLRKTDPEVRDACDRVFRAVVTHDDLRARYPDLRRPPLPVWAYGR